MPRVISKTTLDRIKQEAATYERASRKPRRPLEGGGQVLVWAKGLRRARIEQDMSQQQLAFEAGVSVATIVRLERADKPTRPSLETLERIAVVLGVEVRDLI